MYKIWWSNNPISLSLNNVISYYKMINAALNILTHKIHELSCNVTKRVYKVFLLVSKKVLRDHMRVVVVPLLRYQNDNIGLKCTCLQCLIDYFHDPMCSKVCFVSKKYCHSHCDHWWRSSWLKNVSHMKNLSGLLNLSHNTLWYLPIHLSVCTHTHTHTHTYIFLSFSFSFFKKILFH